MENKIVQLLKRLTEKQEISDKVYNELYPTGSTQVFAISTKVLLI